MEQSPIKTLVWAGYGIRLHGEVDRFRNFLDSTGLECVTTWTAADLLPTDHPQNIGIVGVSGQVGANKAVRECDYLISLGSSVSLAQTGAKEIRKPDEVFHGEHLKAYFGAHHQSVTPWASHLKSLNRMPQVGSYLFNDTMTRLLPPGSIMVVDGGGTALYTGFQSSYIKEGSRLICSSAISAMGSGIPESVGACLASGRRLTTCLIGDGSLMMNVQELATVKHHGLPIKIFVISNGGYLAIRHTQDGYLESRYNGVNEKDLWFPDISNLAHAFNIPYARCEKPYDAQLIGEVLDAPGPTICEVITPNDQAMLGQMV